MRFKIVGTAFHPGLALCLLCAAQTKERRNAKTFETRMMFLRKGFARMGQLSFVEFAGGIPGSDHQVLDSGFRTNSVTFEQPCIATMIAGFTGWQRPISTVNHRQNHLVIALSH
jgi:hypothetical protein